MKRFNQELPDKYKWDDDAKANLKIIVKRGLKIGAVFLTIKGVRLLARDTPVVSDVVKALQDAYKEGTIEEVIQFCASFAIASGVTTALMAYLFIGTKVLKYRKLINLFIFLTLDAVFVYLFPEIPASIFNAVFTQN